LPYAQSKTLLFFGKSFNGAVFVRHGGDHDYYRNLATGIAEAVLRHREIKERLARKIIKLWNYIAPFLFLRQSGCLET
jgi:hypothetical protein